MFYNSLFSKSSPALLSLFILWCKKRELREVQKHLADLDHVLTDGSLKLFDMFHVKVIMSLRIIYALRSYVKHSKERLILTPNTSKLVKNTRLRLIFSTHFSNVWISDKTIFLVFDILLKTFSATAREKISTSYVRNPQKALQKN